MSEELVIALGQEMVKTMVYIAGPMLISAMVVGILISILQAITQINEATMTFIPKIAAVVLVTILLAPWMLRIMQEYAIYIYGNMGDWVR